VYAAAIPELPFKAGVHVHYEETTLPIKDGITKLKNLPKEMGGSGTSLAEKSTGNLAGCGKLDSARAGFSAYSTTTTFVLRFSKHERRVFPQPTRVRRGSLSICIDCDCASSSLVKSID
jgi:hypothetical protein